MWLRQLATRDCFLQWKSAAALLAKEHVFMFGARKMLKVYFRSYRAAGQAYWRPDPYCKCDLDPLYGLKSHLGKDVEAQAVNVADVSQTKQAGEEAAGQHAHGQVEPDGQTFTYNSTVGANNITRGQNTTGVWVRVCVRVSVYVYLTALFCTALCKSLMQIVCHFFLSV